MRLIEKAGARHRLLAAVVLVLVMRSTGSAQKASNAYEFVLNYDVPESPAFVAMGVAPANVVRGAAAKPIVINAVTNVLTTGELDGGLAIDFSPMVFAKPTFTNFDDYAKSFRGKLLRKAAISFAAIEPEDDTSSLKIGAGLRYNFFDRNDPLSSRDLWEAINKVLEAFLQQSTDVVIPGEGAGPGQAIPITNKDQMSAAYNQARESAIARSGWAMSAAYGWAAKLHGAVLQRDSIRDGQHHLWLAGRYKFDTPASFLFTARWKDIGGDQDALLGGIAVRAEFPKASVAAEIAYDFAAGKAKPGANAEIAAFSGARIVVAITPEEDDDDSADHTTRLKLHAAVKWNLVEALRK